MARPLKNGLDYFPMDVDFFSDIKIRKLIKFQGAKAIAVYSYLLCIIYKNGYYCEWDNDLPFIISEVTGCNEAYISEVIKCLFEIGILNKNMYEKHNILTSAGIQKRYKNVNARSQSIKIMKKYLLIKSEETEVNVTETEVNVTETEVNATETEVNVTLSAQRKEKERKEKKIKENKTKEEREDKEKKRIKEKIAEVQNDSSENEEADSIESNELSSLNSNSLPPPPLKTFFDFKTKDNKIIRIDDAIVEELEKKYPNIDVKKKLADYQNYLEKNPDRLSKINNFMRNLLAKFEVWNNEIEEEDTEYEANEPLDAVKIAEKSNDNLDFDFKCKNNVVVRINEYDVQDFEKKYPLIDVKMKLCDYQDYLEENEQRRPRAEHLVKKIDEKFDAWNREAEERAVKVKDKQEQKWENERSPYFQFRHNIN